MGFSLAGFGAGLAESVVSRIEEERKFSAAALQGRIERASIMKQQREKEQEALTEELRNRKNELTQLGVQDNDLQIAYLTSPLAFEALKKAQSSGIKVDPRTLININKEKLFTGTVDEFITKTTGAAEKVEPAKILQSEGRSMLAPSEFQEQRRFEQLASMRGMSLEDVARAEGGPRARMPEPAASINFAALQKEDKATWKQKLERFETNYADTVQQYGEGSKEAIVAKNQLNAYRATTSNLTEDQMDHAKKLSRAQAIMFDKSMTNVSEQDRKWAEGYLREYEAYKKRQEAAGKQDEKIPTANALASLGRTGGAGAVSLAFGTRAVKGLSIVENPDGSSAVKYTGNDLEAQAAIHRKNQEGVVATLLPYFERDGSVKDKRLEVALRSFQIKLDENGRPVDKDGRSLFEPVSTKPPAPNTAEKATVKPAASYAAPAPAPAAPTPAAAPGPGRAGQGAAPKATASSASVIAEAKDAISKGADRNAVIKRLRDMGITPPGDL